MMSCHGNSEGMLWILEICLFVLYLMEKVKSYGYRYFFKIIDFKWSHIDQFNLDLLKMGS